MIKKRDIHEPQGGREYRLPPSAWLAALIASGSRFTA
jgi:hypothetical protein